MLYLAGDVGEDFVAEEAGVAVADGVVERAAHGVFEGALPFVGIGFDEVVGGRAGGVGDVAGIDEDGDHHGDFLLRDQIVDHVERWVVAVAIEIALAVLEDHERGGSFGIVLRGDVDPVFAFHAVVDFAGVNDFVGECAGRERRVAGRNRA